MNIDEEKGRKLFEIKKNQVKLVQKRGYNVDRERAILNYTYENFINYYIPLAEKNKKTIRNLLSSVYKNENDEKIFVYYADVDSSSKQVGKDIISDFIYQLDSHKTKNGIIITPSISLSSDSKKTITSLLTYNIYVFKENEMAYDPTESFLVPEHKALSVEDQRDFLQRNNISIDQLPVILTSDIISRYYGFRNGQIIEIKRTNLYDTIVQHSLAYRQVKDF